MNQPQELLDAAAEALHKANLIHAAEGLTSKARAFGLLSKQVKDYANDGIHGLRRVNAACAEVKDLQNQRSRNSDAIAALNRLIEAIDEHQ